MKIMFISLIFSICGWSNLVRANEYSADAYIEEGMRFERKGQYFQAARYYFQAAQKAGEQNQAKVYALISNALVAEGLPQAATYFFLKAVSLGNDQDIRLALKGTASLVDDVGSVIFRKYLLKYTREEQFPKAGRDYFLYFMAQENLINQKPHEVVRAISDMTSDFPNYASALFLRGSAYLLLNDVDAGISDFKTCIHVLDHRGSSKTQSQSEVMELKNRCMAGVARGYYQAKRYWDAEEWYESIEMRSFVWPQVQYERAWTAVARGDYNRALGRLVSYKAPALSWFHDSEVELLRALSYLQMCIYDEVEKESVGFMKKYGKVGQDMKSLLDSSADGSPRGLVNLFKRGQAALLKKLQSEDPIDQVMNRFVRSPYFVQLAQTGSKVRRETVYLNAQGDAGNKGLGGFLRDVLAWRWETAQEVGGMFVRDRLATEYKIFLSNVSTIDIAKLEMLRRAKSRVEQVVDYNIGMDEWGQKKRGSLGMPNTKDNQYFWAFNGEFWSDELGDYLFALRPECN